MADISPDPQQVAGHINAVHVMKLQFLILFTGAGESIYVAGFKCFPRFLCTLK
jgi:hypothetical protein